MPVSAPNQPTPVVVERQRLATARREYVGRPEAQSEGVMAGHVPEDDPVTACGCKEISCRIERHASYRESLGFEPRPLDLGGSEIPEEDRSVAAPGCQDRTVRSKRHAFDGVQMTPRNPGLARRQVPEAYRSIFTS